LAGSLTAGILRSEILADERDDVPDVHQHFGSATDGDALCNRHPHRHADPTYGDSDDHRHPAPWSDSVRAVRRPVAHVGTMTSVAGGDLCSGKVP
jgi:hypothetical protein